MEIETMPKAFAMWFSDMNRWSVNSFYSIKWGWANDLISPLGNALEKRCEEIEKASGGVNLVSLHFNGEIEKRDAEFSEFKGKLFKAYPGDIIYSKIDVRNGAIGIIPAKLGVVAVSSEFPVYRIVENKTVPLYIKLLFRCTFFLKAINNMISGASGRKRVQPYQLEAMKVPLPPVSIQQKIIDYWRKNEEFISVSDTKILLLKQKAEETFLASLGVAKNRDSSSHKAFAVPWSKIWRWDITSAKSVESNYASSKYSNKKLRELILPLKETNRRLTPARYPEEQFNYIGMENVEAETGQLVNFAPVSGKAIKSSSVIFDKDHILYGKLRPYLRKVIVPEQFGIEKGIASSEFLAVKPLPNINKQYLAEYLQSSIIAEQAMNAIGARMPRVSTQMFLDYQIPLPPINKQIAIVNTLNKVYEEIALIKKEMGEKNRRVQENIESVILGHRKIEEL